jgi:hypothetical protein
MTYIKNTYVALNVVITFYKFRPNKWKYNKQQTPGPLVHKRTIPAERPPLVDEI